MDMTTAIKRTFEIQTGHKLHSICRFDNAANNQVFKIETEAQPYIFKIYANRDWPEDGKLPFVARKLDEYQMPHSKLFAFNREDDMFPNGYLIEECLPGITADRLTLSNDETLSLFEKLAVLVSRVHQITLTNYGYIGNGIADWRTFSKFIYDMFDDCTTNLRKQNTMDTSYLHAIRTKLYNKLKDCDRYPPVICHGDLSTKNILVHSDKIVLIDWDDAQALCWMADIARLTLWLKLNYGSQAAAVYRKVFLDCYETSYDKSAFDDLEYYLHVWYGLDYLNFAVATPNYQYQSETVKAILDNALMHCGM